MTQQRSATEAVVPIVVRDGRVLVIKRGPEVLMSGYWCPPSGRIEPGETQEQAVAREMEEELGIAVTAKAKVWQCPTHDGGMILHWWLADTDDLELRPDPAEVGAARWVTPEEFLQLTPTFEGDRFFFTDVLPTLRPD